MPPLFYGWVILGMSIIGAMISIPGQTMGVSVFTDDLIRVLGLSRVNLSLAYMVGTIGSAILLTPAGKRMDRYGVRIIATASTFLLGAVLIFMSGLDHILEVLWKVFPIPHWITAFILITLSFFLLRFLGQGMVMLASKNMLMKWFDHHRGMANAILGIFISFGFSLAPRVLNSRIIHSGWNGAWREMGFILITAGALLFWLLGRDNPYDSGMKPDSRKEVKDNPKLPPGHPAHDFTLKQARRTLPFWVMGLTLAMHSLYVTAFTFHIVSIFESAGMTRLQAIGVFLPASILSVLFNFTVSWLSDYIRIRYILIVQLGSQLILMFFMSRLAPGLNYVMVIIGYGIMGGLFNITNSIVWPRYYGTSHLGAITGQIMGFLVAGSALGPYFFSLIKSFTGSYSNASLVCCGFSTILFILAFKVRRPAPPE